jgi:hypothetical protein
MTQIALEQLSDRVNGPVLHYPGRRFPGVLFQGDSLHGFVMMAEAAVRALDEGDLKSARDDIEELRDLLLEHLDHYCDVLRALGLPVPLRAPHE